MGYQINSHWGKMHKAEIEKLNAIVDNEYYNEMRISSKIRIMKVFERLLEKAVSDFNFDVVIGFMTKYDWKWLVYSGNGEAIIKVPTKEEIINSIRKNFFNRGLYEIIELNKPTYSVTSGGIVFDMGTSNPEFATEDNSYLNIYFDIAHFLAD